MDGPRHIWWNFVSSSKDRIEQAKADWKMARSTPFRAKRSSFLCLMTEERLWSQRNET